MIGTTEYILIGVAIVLLFGAKKLPELGRSIGEGIREFRKSSRGLIDSDEETPEKPAEGDKEEKGSKS